MEIAGAGDDDDLVRSHAAELVGTISEFVLDHRTKSMKRADSNEFWDQYDEVDGQVYMLLASGSGTKWESGEKERCEKAADSFFIGL